MLYGQPNASMRAPIALLVSQSWDQADPSSVKLFFKKLCAHIAVLNARELLEAHADDATSLWRSHIQDEKLDVCQLRQKGAEWLVATQFGPETSLTDAAWTWNLQWKLGIAVQHGTRKRLDKHGHLCAQRLEQFHMHSFSCSLALLIKRHNLV